jgi:outer membrane protein assembly factor BamB/predicted component of type VI protein secretion system
MATLEVHDGKSRVAYVTISRDRPALFGSDPRCDIVLNDPNAQAIHGRIRWGRGKFKVEATPEARAVEINGNKVVIASFKQGDELRIGSYRIFLLTPDDVPAEIEKTMVQPMPAGAGMSRLERDDWAKDLQTPAATATAPRKSKKGAIEATDLLEEALPPVSPLPKPKPQSWLQRRLSQLIPSDAPPGEERIVTSPLVIGLVATLATLGLLSYLLWGVIDRRMTDSLYRNAVDNLNDGSFRNAMQGFDRFLAAKPKDSRAGKARVLRAMANVRQYTSGGAAVWSDALKAAQEMVQEVGREDAYKDSSTELAEVVVKIAEGLADRTKGNGDPKSLAEAETAFKFHEQIGGPSAKVLMGRTRVPAKMAEARAAVRKAQMRISALAAMDAAIKGGSAAGIFEARDALVAEYADLATDKAVVERMMRGNELLKQAVTLDSTRRPAETTPRPEPLGRPTSLVLRATPTENAPNALDRPSVAFALAEGYAYGLNGADGTPYWHIPVGLSSPFPPQPVSGSEGSVLAFDARHNELLRLDARTGALLWRQTTNERVADPPLVVGNQVIQTTPTGKLIVIDLASGEVRNTLDLHRPLARTPASHETGQYLYVMADEGSLFVVARDPLSCVDVEYVGHDPGTIACAPVRLSRYLIIAANDRLTEGHWLIYLLDEDGPKLRLVQRLDVPGWTWSPPAALGSVVWMFSDRNGLAAYSMGAYDMKVPFQKVASIVAESKSSGPAFARARTEREVWVASSRTGRYDLDPERGKIAAAWTRTEAGPALAPIQTAGRLEVLTHQYTEGRGVALWGVNPATGAVVWRTVLGAPWPSGLTSMADGEGLVALGIDGNPIKLPRARLQEGGFVEQRLPLPGAFRLPPGPIQRIEIDGATIIVPAPGASQIYVAGTSDEIQTIELPTPLGAPPVAWGRDLLIPGDDGRVYLIDPKTGTSKADPYVPPYDRAKPTHWTTPVVLDAESVAMCDESGRVRRLVRQTKPRPRLVAPGEETNLGDRLTADAASTGTALFLATADNRIRALTGRDLTPLGAWPFEAVRVLGPVTIGPIAVAGDSAGTLFGFDPDGQRRWNVTLREGPPLGTPIVRDDSMWLLTRDGTLQRRALADGTALERFPLGILPAGGPLPVGMDLAIPVAPGTVALMNPATAAKGEQP